MTLDPLMECINAEGNALTRLRFPEHTGGGELWFPLHCTHRLIAEPLPRPASFHVETSAFNLLLSMETQNEQTRVGAFGQTTLGS